MKRVWLQVVMALSAINIWTGAPLLALWVGSRVATSSSQVSMGSVALVAIVMFGTAIGLVVVLGRASAAYDELTGRPRHVKRHVPWLRSVRGERVEHERERQGLTTLERLLVVMVVLAILVFEAWFFIASPSPIEPGPSKD